jgi:hypothetical protein
MKDGEVTLRKVWGDMYEHICTVVVQLNDDLFHRLETVHFFRLFTGEGDVENTGRGNTEPRDLKARVQVQVSMFYTVMEA